MLTPDGKLKFVNAFDDFRIRIDDIYEALMDAHLELFAAVLVYERGAIDGVLLYLCRQRHGP